MSTAKVFVTKDGQTVMGHDFIDPSVNVIHVNQKANMIQQFENHTA